MSVAQANNLILRWGVKRSLLEYVDDVVGEISIEAPAQKTEDGVFDFPLASSHTEGDTRELQFNGAIRITAHGGLMSIPIESPWLELSGRAGNLFVTSEGSGPLRIAELRRTDTCGDATEELWAASLAAESAPLFGGVYPPSTEMDPVRLTA